MPLLVTEKNYRKLGASSGGRGAEDRAGREDANAGWDVGLCGEVAGHLCAGSNAPNSCPCDENKGNGGGQERNETGKENEG